MHSRAFPRCLQWDFISQQCGRKYRWITYLQNSFWVFAVRKLLTFYYLCGIILCWVKHIKNILIRRSLHIFTTFATKIQNQRNNDLHMAWCDVHTTSQVTHWANHMFKSCCQRNQLSILSISYAIAVMVAIQFLGSLIPMMMLYFWTESELNVRLRSCWSKESWLSDSEATR